MQITINNRYNDAITFTQLEENKFLMGGGKYCRYGWDSEDDLAAKRYTFVDPSGGPYISQGMTMGYIHQAWIGKIVNYITVDEESGNKIIITYLERIVKAMVNNKDEFRIYSAEGNIITTEQSFNEAVKWIEDKYERRQASEAGHRPTE
jgi:hypothetical protein